MRTRDRCSPATEVAMISMCIGLFDEDISRSTENRPRGSGVARIPLTLTVASGDVRPAIVTKVEANTESLGGEVTSSIKFADSGNGAGAEGRAGPRERGRGKRLCWGKRRSGGQGGLDGSRYRRDAGWSRRDGRRNSYHGCSWRGCAPLTTTGYQSAQHNNYAKGRQPGPPPPKH